jgi:hypothetical protein
MSMEVMTTLTSATVLLVRKTMDLWVHQMLVGPILHEAETGLTPVV